MLESAMFSATLSRSEECCPHLCVFTLPRLKSVYNALFVESHVVLILFVPDFSYCQKNLL